MAHPAETYWTAIASKDADTMASCYAADATFQDPVFSLEGEAIGKMWKSLFGGAKDLEIRTEPLQVDGDIATGTWHADYTFTTTGRKVHNTIHSTFEAAGGAIVAQEDVFDFWKWSRMALGTAGTLLGWTPMLRNKVRAQAAKRLK